MSLPSNVYGETDNLTVFLDDKANRLLTPQRIGQKGSTLSRLLKAGFPVPLGFCITSAASHSVFLRVMPNQPHAGGKSTESTPMDKKRLKQRLLSQLRGDAKLSNSIQSGYARLISLTSKPWIAVRSSAVAEDLDQLSFAGQFRTILYVEKGALLEAIALCWASFWEPSVRQYARKFGVELGWSGFAVIVQAMIEANAAGVAFSMDPTSGAQNRLVIESSWGIGEGVVSGTVTPDRFILEKDSLKIVEKYVGAKEGMETAKARSRSSFSLTEEQAKEIGALCRSVEMHLKKPQDIEWALDDNSLWLLQARAITA